jgi:hypothetical protein
MRDLTNGQLIKKHEQISRKLSKLTDKFIDAGLGHLRPSDMRERPDCLLSVQCIELMEQAGAIRYEAERRYGPDLMFISQLRYQTMKRRA